MNEEFKIGDVVRLKSGSIEMTITEIDSNIAKLTWMDNSNVMTEKELPLEAITTESKYATAL
ncbi:hypothetical protein AV926_04860 [Myroides marinus]|uniref:DUF2158 domain-containing protein n=1 Tax=Myroides marinus TaxID=703342 RepID=A0A165RK40_9FLAO|nr:DUF2158 domain-containing protein [Myroides marinus]KZE82882.1 hypothetical protein AV926_04860 [Myroides marinus]